VLDIRDLTTSFGPVKALDAVTFTAPKGKITAVLGANGAGKTTLLRTVSGLIRPDRGSVHLDGQDLARMPAERMPGLGSALSIADIGVVLNLGRLVAHDEATTLAADEKLRHAYLGF
jgi:branched-chain amino acid transport system ATP-binding protein